ncbi:MAG: UDP-N-acetylmuramoyl-L-alanyl-D-glutamate--2,6-diaminopimelate ligase [Vicinamibacterales bacterium]
MTLGALAGSVQLLSPEARSLVAAPGTAEVRVAAIAHDSRAVLPGTLFVAVRGQNADGAAFAPSAIEKGAVAVVAESAAPAGTQVPWLQVSNARLALAELSAIFYDRPSESLTVIGVTGTNGKTTTTYLLAAVMDAAGLPCGRLGTVSVRTGPVPGDEIDASHTTPESTEVQRLLREMVTRGCKACAMEVSSHALVLHRVASLRFAAAIFTNLTRDHLDFHGDMASYFEAKRGLFNLLPPGMPAAINLDDPRGPELAASVPGAITFGINRAADVRPESVQSTLDGLAFDVVTPRGRLAVRSPLVGWPNVYNILGVVTCAIALDLPTAAIELGLSQLDGVPGRFQVVSGSTDDVRVVVDYAHTDDALKNLLETARPLTHSRLITVFGCGGDRDRSKRPLMGAVAARLSDLVVLTSDNPRSEDPDRIIDEIKRGIVQPVDPGAPRRPGTPLIVQRDRRIAIEQAIRASRAGDVVLIAGKGHEKYQVIGDRTSPFDDVEVARAALSQRRPAPSV